MNSVDFLPERVRRRRVYRRRLTGLVGSLAILAALVAVLVSTRVGRRVSPAAAVAGQMFRRAEIGGKLCRADVSVDAVTGRADACIAVGRKGAPSASERADGFKVVHVTPETCVIRKGSLKVTLEIADHTGRPSRKAEIE